MKIDHAAFNAVWMWSCHDCAQIPRTHQTTLPIVATEAQEHWMEHPSHRVIISYDERAEPPDVVDGWEDSL